jgi:hypothetical protein
LGLVAEAFSAAVRSAAEKESLRGMVERWVGRGIVSVILAVVVKLLSVVLGADLDFDCSVGVVVICRCGGLLAGVDSNRRWER